MLIKSKNISQGESQTPHADPDYRDWNNILSNPYHYLKDGDQILDQLFCIKCGELIRPKIHKKVILDEMPKLEYYEESFFDENGMETKINKAKLIDNLISYCEILKCSICNDYIYRVFNIFENNTIPEGQIKIIPQRKDESVINNENLNSDFKKIYERYCEAVSAYNSSLLYSSGVSIRSVIELICKNENIYHEIIEERKKNHINKGKLINNDTIEKIKRQIGLEEQMKRLIVLVKEKADKIFDIADVEDMINILYWMNNIVHGQVPPTENELKKAICIIEEIFIILYFDPAKAIKIEEEKRDSALRLKELNKDFKSYNRRR